MAHATAIKTIGRLKREGLAVAKPYRGVFLTRPGRTLRQGAGAASGGGRSAAGVGVPSEARELDAEGIEHHVSDTTLAAFARFLTRK